MSQAKESFRSILNTAIRFLGELAEEHVAELREEVGENLKDGNIEDATSCNVMADALENGSVLMKDPEIAIRCAAGPEACELLEQIEAFGRTHPYLFPAALAEKLRMFLVSLSVDCLDDAG